MILKNIFRPKTIIFIILTVIILLLVPKLKGLMLLLFAAFIIAAALNPVVNSLDYKFKNRSISSSVVVLMTIVSLSALFLPILIMCYKEVMLFLAIMPQKVNGLYNFLTNTKLYGKTLSQIIPSDNIVNFTSDIQNYAYPLVKDVRGMFFNCISNMLSLRLISFIARLYFASAIATAAELSVSSVIFAQHL